MSVTAKKLLRRTLLSLACLLLALLLIVGGYLAYVLIAYHRIGDEDTAIHARATGTLAAGEEYNILTWNIGFAAYSQDFSFFMDGGTESRAYSEDEVKKNLAGILSRLKQENADLMLLQEIDTDATRSYHVDEQAYLENGLPDYSATFARNYDSPYLFYPILSPHGRSRAGLLTLAATSVTSARRVELPIEQGFMKFLDLDRCYHKVAIPIEDGKTLYLYNLHLSAYTSDGTISTEQLRLLLADMQGELDRGGYVIAGGDFNKDLLHEHKNATDTWAQPLPLELLGERFSLVAGDRTVHSCRNCDEGYQKGHTFEVTVDGFIVSDNITVTAVTTIDEAFMHSDHNPVKMSFILKP